MKKIVFFTVACIVLCALLIPKTGEAQQQYYRIHIRANSNEQVDQSIKYLIRDAVVEYLTPYLAYADTKEKAETVLLSHLNEIENATNALLQGAGYTYTAQARLCREQFPTRNYGQLTLKSGVYDALVIDLGQGQGDNWWCVIYPPLCFVGQTNDTNQIRYVSKLKQIIDNFIAQYCTE